MVNMSINKTYEIILNNFQEIEQASELFSTELFHSDGVYETELISYEDKESLLELTNIENPLLSSVITKLINDFDLYDSFKFFYYS